MKALLHLLAVIVLVDIVFAADPGPKGEIYFPHEHVQKIPVADGVMPYEKRLTMKEHDAVIFILPGQKSVSVWCYRTEDREYHAEQTTKSGLKTSWAEKPWIMPRMKWKAVGEASFQADGWDSYIEQGGVTTIAGAKSNYTLYVEKYQINIIEDLSDAIALPVTIRVSRTNR